MVYTVTCSVIQCIAGPTDPLNVHQGILIDMVYILDIITCIFNLTKKSEFTMFLLVILNIVFVIKMFRQPKNIWPRMAMTYTWPGPAAATIEH